MKPAVRMAIYDRAQGMCENIIDGERCCAPLGEVHHIVHKGMGGRHGDAKRQIESMENYLAVCVACHRKRKGHGG